MAEEEDTEMNLASLRKQAADLKAELSLDCPRVTVVRDLLDDIAGDIGPRRLRPIRLHETGLMEQLVALLIT